MSDGRFPPSAAEAGMASSNDPAPVRARMVYDEDGLYSFPETADDMAVTVPTVIVPGFGEPRRMFLCENAAHRSFVDTEDEAEALLAAPGWAGAAVHQVWVILHKQVPNAHQQRIHFETQRTDARQTRG